MEQQQDGGVGYLTTREAGARLGMTAGGVRNLCLHGSLPAHKEPLDQWTGYCGPGMPLAWFIAPADLESFLAAREAARETRVRERARPPRLTPYQELEVATRELYAPPTPHDKQRGYPVLREVCAYYKLSRATLEGPSRDGYVMQARRVAAHLLATRAGLGVVAIGRLLRRDHSTVLHHLRLMQHGPTAEERDALADIEARLAGSGAGQREAAAS